MSVRKSALDAVHRLLLLFRRGFCSLKFRFRNMRKEYDDKSKCKNSHCNEQGRISICNLRLGRVTNQISYKHGHYRCCEGIQRAAELNELIALVSAAAESVQHRVHNRIEHTH